MASVCSPGESALTSSEPKTFSGLWYILSPILIWGRDVSIISFWNMVVVKSSVLTWVVNNSNFYLLWYQRNIFVSPPAGLERERFSVLLIIVLFQPNLIFFLKKNCFFFFFFVTHLFSFWSPQESCMAPWVFVKRRMTFPTKLSALIYACLIRGRKLENLWELFIISICFPFQHLKATVNWLFWQRGLKWNDWGGIFPPWWNWLTSLCDQL